MKKSLNKFEVLKEYKEMLTHNLLAYSSDYLMNKPKKQYVKEWEETQEKISLVEEMMEDNKQINRIQLIFDSIPDESIRTALKSKGFHWSRREGAWQREFNENTIRATNILIRDVLNKEQEQEDEEEFE